MRFRNVNAYKMLGRLPRRLWPLMRLLAVNRMVRS
jgi:hypothetical protein